MVSADITALAERSATGGYQEYRGFQLVPEGIGRGGKLKRYFCISLEARRRQVGGVTILPIHEFLRNLWDESYS